MATLTIRNFDDDLKSRLRIEAALHQRSMEEEVRVILRHALTKQSNQDGFGQRIHRRFSALDVAELELPSRQEMPRPADLPT